jgi:MFS family permease
VNRRRRFGHAARKTFASLRIRNYRLYFFGQIVSLTGTWMQSVGQAWLVLKLTGSGVDLGVVTALQFLPIMLLGPLGGLVADRVDKRRLVMATQTAAGVLALMLGVLTVTGSVRLWMVYVLALSLGTVSLLDMPARQSFVMEMVGRDDLPNAVSLNSVVVNGARVIGPATAGVLIATVGIGVCFLLNGLSYVAVVAAFLLMRPEELQRTAPVARKPGQLREGLRYVWAKPDLRLAVLLMAVVGTFAYNFSVVMPLLVKFTFGQGAGSYGALFSVMGVGAVTGGLIIAARGKVSRELLVGATVAFGAAILAGAVAPDLVTELALMLPIGAVSTVFVATSNSLLQLGAGPEMRGRVMAVFTMVFMGTTPVGGPLVGWVAQRFGPRVALGLGGGATLVAGTAALLALRRVARRAAEAKLPVAEPIAAATRPEVAEPALETQPHEIPAGTRRRRIAVN